MREKKTHIYVDSQEKSILLHSDYSQAWRYLLRQIKPRCRLRARRQAQTRTYYL